MTARELLREVADDLTCRYADGTTCGVCEECTYAIQLRLLAGRIDAEMAELRAAQTPDSPWLASELRTLERLDAPLEGNPR